MDVSNASHYDGATATAEAAVMAYHNFRGKRTKILMAHTVHPHYRQTVRTYLQGYTDVSIEGDAVPGDALDSPCNTLTGQIDANTALVVVQYPDFFGRLYDYTEMVQAAHAQGALVCIVTNPIALGLIKAPGAFDADIVVGEGQPLGIPLSYGGPYLGIFAVKKDYVRKIAGRLVGETIDGQGRRAYVLTLTAREQHIRREKATSNICTNVGLIALASTVYMSLLGKHGLRKVAELCYQKAHYAAEEIASIPGFSVCSGAPFFHEFIVCCPTSAEEINAHLLEHNILGGYDLSQDYPAMKNQMLLAVTEMNSRDQIDALVDALKEFSDD
jgi:glycine dehydrogenase subunit 1